MFVDEIGVNTAMARTHGRAAPGERVIGRVPKGHWQMTTVVWAVRLAGCCAAMMMDGGTDAVAFEAFVEHFLVPSLRPGDIVVMDNLQAHKAAAVKPLIEAAGASVAYLPPYSPDYNPIEKMWSKVKQFLRSAAARTQEALHEAIGHALRAVTARDCLGWFGSCGYIATES